MSFRRQNHVEKVVKRCVCVCVYVCVCLCVCSLMYALYNGGPWYIRIDFIEARERKHYETSLPSVTARLGHVPRGSFISAKRVLSMVR